MSKPPTSHVSDDFLANIVKSSTDAIVCKDLNGVITWWNEGAARLFGYSAAEAIGQPITIIFPPDRVNEEPSIIAKIRKGERVEHYQTVRLRKDGSNVDVSVTISPILDDEGRIIGASKVARDISLEKRDSERFKVTLASIGDAVIATDQKGRVTFLNGIAGKLTGWSEEEAMGQPLATVFRIVNETTRLPVTNPVAKVLEQGGIVGLANHTVLISKDGGEYPIDDSAAPIRTQAGLVGVVLVFRDITARRAAERSAVLLASIVDGSDDAIIGKNMEGVVTAWNPGAERLFGYSAQEFIGQPIIRLLPSDRRDEEDRILGRLRTGERIANFETIRIRKDGTPVYVSLTISPIRDRNGVVIGASKIARDVTALRSAREKLERRAEDLEQRVRERTERLEETVAELESFSYSMSHDMRAPIRAIQSFAEIVIADYGRMIPEGVEYLRKVIKAAGRMDRLIQDVLAFARLTRMEIKVEPIDAGKLAHDIIRERPELQPPVRVHIRGPFPLVIGHEASLTQCLTNLLDNAVKFVAPGTVPEVAIFAEPGEDWVRICVKDNGIGIDRAGQDRLFDIFQRLPTPHRYEGTGVGLAIVRKAAERMQGRAGVESEPGKGSTFWVDLPRAK